MWSVTNVVCCECGLLRMWSVTNVVCYEWGVMNGVRYELGPL